MSRHPVEALKASGAMSHRKLIAVHLRQSPQHLALTTPLSGFFV